MICVNNKNYFIIAKFRTKVFSLILIVINMAPNNMRIIALCGCLQYYLLEAIKINL